MLEIFELGFMRRAFAAGIVIAVMAPLIGTYLVIRRYSMMADTLAHVSLVGVALGLLTRTYPELWAMLVSVCTAFGIERLKSKGKVYGESAVGLFLWAGMALAVVLISLAKGFNVDLFSFLFGSITTVTTRDLRYILILAVVVIGVIIVLYNPLFSTSFDEEYAQASGIQPKNFNIIIVVLAAVTISACIRVVGMLLIGALMVIPVLTSMQFAQSFKQTLLLSVVFSLLSVISGLLLSYYFDIASGGTIVLVAFGVFIIGSFFKD
ncbi:MAG: metal ABC transporter permease [Nitrospirae bacterium]|nr:metal ABC transporter permease [Nitrospirota bacterium]MBF0592325.1 metal ABC transporter permease [Nitrospirota bacterium]